jgi:hypothetical protein
MSFIDLGIFQKLDDVTIPFIFVAGEEKDNSKKNYCEKINKTVSVYLF